MHAVLFHILSLAQQQILLINYLREFDVMCPFQLPSLMFRERAAH